MKGDRRADRSTLPEHIQCVRSVRIEAQLYTPTNQRRIDRIAIASQRHGSSGRDAPQHRPTERFAQERRLDREWTVAGESINGRLAGLGVLTRIADLLRPREETIVQLGEAGDAVGFGFGQEPFADKSVEPLELAAAFGRVCGWSRGGSAVRRLRPRATGRYQSRVRVRDSHPQLIHSNTPPHAGRLDTWTQMDSSSPPRHPERASRKVLALVPVGRVEVRQNYASSVATPGANQ